MKKVLFIAATVCLFSISSCTNDSIEEIQQQQQLQHELENLNAKDGDTGKDEVTDDDV